MKKFLAIYTGTAAGMENWHSLDVATRQQREADGMKAWGEWVAAHGDAILDHGSPLGKTKRVAANGVMDIRNNMAAYTLVQAESHEAAARLFLDHPHFRIFPGDGIEVMECLPVPEM